MKRLLPLLSWLSLLFVGCVAPDVASPADLDESSDVLVIVTPYQHGMYVSPANAMDVTLDADANTAIHFEIQNAEFLDRSTGVRTAVSPASLPYHFGGETAGTVKPGTRLHVQTMRTLLFDVVVWGEVKTAAGPVTGERLTASYCLRD